MTSKEVILAETLRLFSVKGYFNTSIHDILDATGMSKGGLYNHFRSKEELYAAVLELARRIWRERCLHGLDKKRTPIEKIKTLLENYRDRYLKDGHNFPGGCVFIVLAVEMSNQQPDLARELEAGYTGLKNLFQRLLQEAAASGLLRASVSAEAAVEIIFSGMLGASLVYGNTRSNARLDSTIAALLGYLDGICAAR